MEPPFVEEFDDVDELDELESEAAVNQRQFLMLVLGLGGILIVAVVAFVWVMLQQDGERSDIELTNEARLATNRAIEEAIVATQTAEVVQSTAQAVAMVQTQEAQQQAEAATATAAAEQEPTPTSTSTPTPVVASPVETVTPEAGEEGTVQPGDETPEAVAQVTGTRTPFPRPGTSTTPDTGVGGLGAVLIAAVLVVVMFVARRLRTAG